MKTAQRRSIVETENENTAKETFQIWPESLFGGSQCIESKAKIPLNLILNSVSLLDYIPVTGVDGKDIQEENSKQIPRGIVTCVKKKTIPH